MTNPISVQIACSRTFTELGQLVRETLEREQGWRCEVSTETLSVALQRFEEGGSVGVCIAIHDPDDHSDAGQRPVPYGAVFHFVRQGVPENLRAHYAMCQQFGGLEELLLKVIASIANWAWNTLTDSQSAVSVTSRGSILSKLLNLGPRPYYLVYGRRIASEKSRKTFGSLATQREYIDALNSADPATGPSEVSVAVDPHVDEAVFRTNGCLLLSGPPSSDSSREYFAALSRRGIRLFSGSCLNHLDESCPSMGRHCHSARGRGATGCSWINDGEPVYSFKRHSPATHVAMMVRTPSPWTSEANPEMPWVLYGAGTHSEGGKIAASCLTDDEFMSEFLTSAGFDPGGDDSPSFAVIVSQDTSKRPVIREGGLITWASGVNSSYRRAARVSSDVDLLMVAVNSEELTAAKRVFELPQETELHPLTMSGAKFVQFERNGVNLALLWSGEPGNVKAAQIVQEAVSQLRTRCVALVGIAAGMRGRNKLCDVFVPQVVFSYEPAAERQDRSEPRPDIYRLDKPISDWWYWYSSDEQLKQRLLSAFAILGEDLPEDADFSADLSPKLGEGLASGEKLLRRPEFLTRIRGEGHGKIQVADMEAAGLAECCSRSGIRWFIVRAISDFGDEEKGRHGRAASLAALAAYTVVRDFIDSIVSRGDLLDPW